MKGNIKLVAMILAIASTVAIAKSADARWTHEVVEAATRSVIRTTLPETNSSSQPTSTLSSKDYPLQLAQTAVGSCVVADPTGSPLNVRATPGGKTIGSLPNGSQVTLGVTDGSEGRNWTRIIAPFEGYVWSAYLKDCRYKK